MPRTHQRAGARFTVHVAKCGCLRGPAPPRPTLLPGGGAIDTPSRPVPPRPARGGPTRVRVVGSNRGGRPNLIRPFFRLLLPARRSLGQPRPASLGGRRPMCRSRCVVQGAPVFSPGRRPEGGCRGCMGNVSLRHYCNSGAACTRWPSSRCMFALPRQAGASRRKPGYQREQVVPRLFP